MARGEVVDVRSNLIATFELGLNQLLDLTRGHRLVHPDSDQCGGVGTCLMMRTEVEQEQELQRLTALMASKEISLRVTEAKS